MKLRYMMLLASCVSFVPVSSGSCMEDESNSDHPSISVKSEDNNDSDERTEFQVPKDRDERIKFVQAFTRTFVPKDSSEEYIEKVANAYWDTLSYKHEIEHDDRPMGMLLPGKVYSDYGWNFPSIPLIQKELLYFCANAPQEVRIMDVGPGHGLDSMYALLTRKAKVTAVELLKQQSELTKQVVRGSILQNVDPQFPVSKFTVINQDFLKMKTLPILQGTFDGINANKVIHFFDPEQTRQFREQASFFLKPQGRLFLTCLTPSPGSEIEEFMSSEKQKKEEYPGYLFYRLKSKIENSAQGGITLGKSKLIEVRQPKDEKNAYFKQDYDRKSDSAITGRVMHYHTEETLARALGPNFKITKTFILSPEETHGTDHMISIVAERL